MAIRALLLETPPSRHTGQDHLTNASPTLSSTSSPTGSVDTGSAFWKRPLDTSASPPPAFLKPASANSCSLATLLGKRHGKPPPPYVPPQPMKRITRKNASVVVSHGPPGQPIIPELRAFKFATYTSNTDTLRNYNSAFLAHPHNEILKFRVADNPVSSTVAHTVIIHPGSRFIRAGFDTDLVPRVIVPNCIARWTDPTIPSSYKKWSVLDDSVTEDASDGADRMERMDAFLSARIKEENIRVPFNARNLISSFNAQAKPTLISQVNDPIQIEWTALKDPSVNQVPYYLGQAALDMDDRTRNWYPIKYPMIAKSMNTADYRCWEEWHQDVCAILTGILGTLDVNAKEARVILIVPDLLDVRCVDEYLRVLLQSIGVLKVSVASESVMSCLGAGLMSGTVVDIGAQATSISIVENGELVDSMRVLVGGDDVTASLRDLLVRTRNPVARHFHNALEIIHPKSQDEINFRSVLEGMKESLCTCIVNELAIQSVDVHIRTPHADTIRFSTKLYDEVYLAPLCYIYPNKADIYRKLVDYKRYAPLLVEQAYERRINPLWALDIPARMISNGLTPPEPRDQLHPGQDHRCALTAQLMYMDEIVQGVAADLAHQESQLQFPPFTDPQPKRATPQPNHEIKKQQKQKVQTYIETKCGQSIDQAIHYLLSTQKTYDRIRRSYGSILVVGGGSKITAYATRMLEMQLAISMPAYIEPHLVDPHQKFVSVAVPGREVDGRNVMFKGGTVLARLDCVQDMFMDVGEYLSMGVCSLLVSKCGLVCPGMVSVSNLAGPTAALAVDHL